MKTVSRIHMFFFRFFVCFIVSNLIVAGCALQHPVPSFHFTAPTINQRFPIGTIIDIKLRTWAVSGDFDNTSYRLEYQVKDNGNSIIPGTSRIISPPVRDIVLPPYPTAGLVEGAHMFQARARIIKISNSQSSGWVETQVCVWIGANAPRDFTCPVFGWPQALEAAPTDTIIQLEEPQLEEPQLEDPPLLLPLAEASSTATPEACIWEAMLNVYFRKGPDVGLYDKLDAVEKGTTLPIVGQSEDGAFWVVQIQPDLNGYVTKSDKYSHTTGDCSKVLTLKDPEPPVIVPAPQNQPDGGGAADCSSYTTDSACNAVSGCSYDYTTKVCK
jgi:hypothetical protein